MKLYCTLFLILISSLISIAQTNEVELFFNNYIEAVNQINSRGNLDEVMDFFHPDFQVNRTFIGPKGKLERTSLSLSDFASGLETLTIKRDIKMNMKVEEISKIIVGQAASSLSAVISINMYVDGSFAEESGMVANYAILKDKQGNWKFAHSDVVQTLVKRDVGSCPSRFFRKDNSIIAELYYPAGFEYRNVLEPFNFKTRDKQRTITNNLKTFNWDIDGSVKSLKDDNWTQIGVAQTEEEAVKVILADLYRVNCLEFKRF